jgi:hypothetical protein
MDGKCKNCGADKALHHYKTTQCPTFGREAPVGQEQEWRHTMYEATDNKDEIIKDLLEACKWMHEWLKEYENYISDFDRNIYEKAEAAISKAEEGG